MKLLLCALLSLTIPAALLTEPLHAGTSIALKNTVILVIRHAEQSDSGGDLSDAGNARANTYANYFKNFTTDGRPLKLDYLFAAANSRVSLRPRLTIEPIAKELDLVIDTRFKNRQFQELADEIQRRPHGNILISWHHGKIPQLLRALGADPKSLLPNGKWPNDVFDWVIELRYDDNGDLSESKLIDEKFTR